MTRLTMTLPHRRVCVCVCVCVCLCVCVRTWSCLSVLCYCIASVLSAWGVCVSTQIRASLFIIGPAEVNTLTTLTHVAMTGYSLFNPSNPCHAHLFVLASVQERDSQSECDICKTGSPSPFCRQFEFALQKGLEKSNPFSFCF